MMPSLCRLAILAHRVWDWVQYRIYLILYT